MGKRSLEDMIDAEKMASNGDAMVRFGVLYFFIVIARVQTRGKIMEAVSRQVFFFNFLVGYRPATSNNNAYKRFSLDTNESSVSLLE